MDSGDEEEEAVSARTKDFTTLQPVLENIVKNLASKNIEFTKMQDMTLQEKIAMHSKGDLESLSKTWQKSLELQLPEGVNISADTMSAFTAENNSTFKEVERLMHMVEDWVSETVHEVKENMPVEKPEAEQTVPVRRNDSSIQLQKAQFEAQEEIKRKIESQNAAKEKAQR